MIKMLFSLVVICLIHPNTIGQELPKNLVYANESFEFDRISFVGENIILRKNTRKGKPIRKSFLLNKSRVLTDTMKMYDGTAWLVRSDSSFSVNTTKYIDVNIENDRFVTKKGINLHANFRSILSPIFFIKDFLLGKVYKSDDDCSSYHYLSKDHLSVLAGIVEKAPDWYGYDDLDTVFILDVKKFKKLTGETYDDLLIKELYPFDKSCQERLESPYYGWNEYAFANDNFYMYERASAMLLAFDMTGEPRLTKSIELPVLDKENEGWKYLYDRKSDKHYTVKRIDITIADPKLNKRKARNVEREYRYELFEVLEDPWNLEPLYNLKFSPALIDDGLLYEIVKEEGKGSALYFHPLDPNYKYEKSRLIYSSNK